MKTWFYDIFSAIMQKIFHCKIVNDRQYCGIWEHSEQSKNYHKCLIFLELSADFLCELLILHSFGKRVKFAIFTFLVIIDGEANMTPFLILVLKRL